MEGSTAFSWRAWVVSLLAAALLSAGATLLLGASLRPEPTTAAAQGGGHCRPTEGK